MCIHLPGRHDVSLFHPQSLSLRTKSSSLSIFCFFWAVSRRYATAMLDFTRLFISFTLRQVVSGLPATFFFCGQVFLGRFECFSRQIFRQLMLLVLSSGFWTGKCQNQTPILTFYIFKKVRVPNNLLRFRQGSVPFFFFFSDTNTTNNYQ